MADGSCRTPIRSDMMMMMMMMMMVSYDEPVLLLHGA
jgi:hypothetical protein